MKKLLIIFLAFSVLAGCRMKRGSGNIVTEKRNTGSFKGISVGGGFNVELKTGATEVIVESDDNIIKYIETEVENGQLKVRLSHINNLSDAHLKVYISSPEINDIEASASADIEAKDVLKSGGTMELHSSSGSNINAKLDAPEIIANASSGGGIDLSGRTRDLKATSSSGSTIDAKELLSENTTANVSSGATAHVHASLSLDATASSGGHITYRGGAVNVKKSESSGGGVEKE